MDRTRDIIAVIGSRDATDEQLETAYRVGREIALSDRVLLTGGLGGVMEAASRGAKEAGGLVIGILPQEEKGWANRYVDVPIATGLGIGRNVIIARTADALVAVGGGYGTLSEIAFALQLGKPVVGIGAWQIEGIIKAQTPEEAVKKALNLISG
ncbi:MAG: TIGR00725 family protein [Nitrospirae bacterium]|nr:MAG: TIGR00725 family protein [Nitrospirota bacterium]